MLQSVYVNPSFTQTADAIYIWLRLWGISDKDFGNPISYSNSIASNYIKTKFSTHCLKNCECEKLLLVFKITLYTYKFSQKKLIAFKFKIRNFSLNEYWVLTKYKVSTVIGLASTLGFRHKQRDTHFSYMRTQEPPMFTVIWFSRYATRISLISCFL